MAKPEKTIYEELGGEALIAQAVKVFYRRVVADPRIASFFEGVDLIRQVDKQKAFLTMIFGGPHQYTGRDMKTVHSRLVARGLADGHVDALLENLGSALDEVGVRRPLIARILVQANRYRDEVLSR